MGERHIRVLHLITRFLDGGAETTTVNTLRALAESNDNYDLRLGFGRGHDEERLSDVEELGVKTVEFKHIRHYNPIAATVSVFTVALYLRREKIDIIHTHSTEAGIIGRLAGGLAGTPVRIHEIHGDPITEDRRRLLNIFVCTMERVTAPLSTVLVAKSSRIRDQFLDRGIGTESQYEVIRHGISTMTFREGSPSLDTPDNRIVLFVGRLEKGKGLFDLLDAFEVVRGAHDVTLLIAGSGSLEGPLAEEISSRNLQNDVRLLGYRDDIPDLLSSADLLVLPSYREGTPRAVTEALASGTPVVSTRVAGIPEQVTDGETGFLVEAGDTEALADRIGKIVSSPDLAREMGRRAQKSAERYDVALSRERYLDLYGRLVKGLR